VLRAWAFALVFSAVSSLRQTNVQNLVFYGELSVLGKDYLLSQHANSKARNKTPTVFITPLHTKWELMPAYSAAVEGVWNSYTPTQSVEALNPLFIMHVTPNADSFPV